jgi:hypothetical protein
MPATGGSALVIGGDGGEVTQAQLHFQTERVLRFDQDPQQQFEIRRRGQQAPAHFGGQRDRQALCRRFRNRPDEPGDVCEHALGTPQQRVVVATYRLMRAHRCHRTALINVSYISLTVVMTCAAAE